jgi:hypothetical protein
MIRHYWLDTCSPFLLRGICHYHKSSWEEGVKTMIKLKILSLRYNTVKSVDIQPTFRRIMSPPSSGLKNKPSRQIWGGYSWIRSTSSACYVSSWFLVWFILRTWRWKRHVPPKRWLTFNGMDGIIFHIIITDLRISHPTKLILILSIYWPSTQHFWCTIYLYFIYILQYGYTTCFDHNFWSSSGITWTHFKWSTTLDTIRIRIG